MSNRGKKMLAKTSGPMLIGKKGGHYYVTAGGHKVYVSKSAFVKPYHSGIEGSEEVLARSHFKHAFLDPGLVHDTPAPAGHGFSSHAEHKAEFGSTEEGLMALGAAKSAGPAYGAAPQVAVGMDGKLVGLPKEKPPGYWSPTLSHEQAWTWHLAGFRCDPKTKLYIHDPSGTTMLTSELKTKAPTEKKKYAAWLAYQKWNQKKGYDHQVPDLFVGQHQPNFPAIHAGGSVSTAAQAKPAAVVAAPPPPLPPPPKPSPAAKLSGWMAPEPAKPMDPAGGPTKDAQGNLTWPPTSPPPGYWSPKISLEQAWTWHQAGFVCDPATKKYHHVESGTSALTPDVVGSKPWEKSKYAKWLKSKGIAIPTLAPGQMPPKLGQTHSPHAAAPPTITKGAPITAPPSGKPDSAFSTPIDQHKVTSSYGSHSQGASFDKWESTQGHTAYVQSLSHATQSTLRAYTGSAYDNINSSLASAQGNSTKLGSHVAEQVRRMDKAMAGGPPLTGDTVLTRACTYKAVPAGMFDKPDLLKGMVITHHPFGSAAGDGDFHGVHADDVRITYHVPAGTQGPLAIKSISGVSSEQEVLLPRGHRMFIKEARHEKVAHKPHGRLHLVVEYIPPDFGNEP